MRREHRPTSPWALVCLVIGLALLAAGLFVALSTAHGGPLTPTELDAGCIGAGPVVIYTPWPPGYVTPTPQPRAPHEVFLPRFVQGGYPEIWCPYKVDASGP